MELFNGIGTFASLLIVGTFLFSAISAFVGILALIFKKTRLFKAKKVEELTKMLKVAETKLNSVKKAWEKGDEGLKLVLEPMVKEAEANVDTIKAEIEKVERSKK